jgi:putative tryptophan/tyrosine transport system substrate-binding protein
MRRRNFIAGLASTTVAWPLAARAQQRAMPVVGLLSSDVQPDLLQAFRQGLKETGYIEHENIAIEYRTAQNQIGRLSEFAADLVHRKVDVIVAGNTSAAFAAKAATTTIPVVFNTPENPVTLGLVTSLARPGGNLTGINWLGGELSAKRLGLLHELIPGAARIALLVEPNNGRVTETTVRGRRGGSPLHRPANPGAQCQHEWRDRCSVRDYCARASRRPLRRLQPSF